jgi:hypothetical protein
VHYSCGGDAHQQELAWKQLTDLLAEFLLLPGTS